jgi:hypothetical protein
VSITPQQKARIASHTLLMVVHGVASGLSYEEGLISARVLVELMEIIDKLPTVDEDALLTHISKFIDKQEL